MRWLIVKTAYVALTVLLVIGVVSSCEKQALAYADPGSGLLVVQAIAAVLTSAGYYLRRRIKNILVRKTGKLFTGIRPTDPWK
jgi:hypothetical protein